MKPNTLVAPTGNRLCCRLATGSLRLVVALITIAQAAAQPAYVNYQGRLTDDQGQPLSNGQYALDFRIYDDPLLTDATNLVWGLFYCDGGTGPGHAPAANLLGGRFNVILGPVDENGRSITDAFQGDARFLEIRLKGGSPILPRQQMLSAPFAFKSGEAERAQLAASLVEELANALCPAGSIIAFGGAAGKVPTGWLLCDGSAVSSTNYARLFDAIGTAWGDGSVDANTGAENPDNPATDFNLPDLRGLFLRGANLNSTNALSVDPDSSSRAALLPGGNLGNAVGSRQTDGFKSHNHDAPPYNRLVRVDDGWNTAKADLHIGSQIDIIRSDTIRSVGGNETRPKNAYVNYIIKY